MSLPRYPEYKDSGVVWLGEVPAHWESWRVSQAFGSIGSGTTPPSNEHEWYADGTIPWITTGELRETVIYETSKVVTKAAVEKFSALRIHPAGSLAIAMYGATIGRLGILGVNATVNQACCILSYPRTLDVQFVFYWLLGFKQNLIDLYATGGGQPNINQEIIASLRIPAPCLNEQAAIIKFLDREKAKIDGLIAEQEKLIALLAEKRQATISHVITKGLNPDAPMKNSGVEGLGEIPSHWTVISLTHLTTEKCDGPFGSGIKSEHYKDDGALVIRLQNIRATGFFDGEPAYLDLDYFQHELQRHNVIPGDILVAGLGDDRNLVGRACVAPDNLGPALVKADCFRFRLIADFPMPDFVATQLSATAICDGGRLATGSTRSRIPLSVMASRKMAMPPTEEQADIVRFIKSENARLDELTAEATRGIALLKERRSALISAAVTGKIDVRYLVDEPKSELCPTEFSDI